MARRPYTVFFYLRLTVLLSLLGLSLVGWQFVEQLGGPTQIIPELLRTHVQREEDSTSALEARVATDILALKPSFTNTLSNRISAARSLAEEGLARKKTYVSSGLSVSYGVTGALMRIANNDNSDLHKAAGLLVMTLEDSSERLRLESGYALSHLQLDTRHSHLVRYIRRALDSEYNVAIKIYLARTLGDIGPPAATARDSVSALLEEDDPVLIASAATALSRMGPAAYALETEARLLGLMTHADASVRDHSAETLGAIGSFTSSAERALRKALADEDPYVRVAAALALTDIGLTDEPVLAALDEGHKLVPRTTIYVEDVARVVSIRSRVTGIFTGLSKAPDELVPTLVAMATQAGDIEHRENAIALLAGKDGYSEARAKILVELLQDRDVWVYYAVADGLIGMGKDVLPLVRPLLDHEDHNTREMAAKIVAKLDPPKVEKAAVDVAGLMASYQQADNSFSRQEVAAAMAESGELQLLDFLMAHADDRVLNGPVLDVVTHRLIEKLQHYKFQPTTEHEPRRLAVRSLSHFGVLTAQERQAFLGDLENPDLGDQVRELWLARRAVPPRPPSEREILQEIYTELQTPRNEEVARYAEQLLTADRATRLQALGGLERIAGHAVEAPTYIYLAVRDPDEKVRTMAVTVFLNTGLQTVEAIEALAAALNNTRQSDYLNSLAARALAQIGKPALATLSNAAEHEAVAVRRAATFGLLKLGRDAAPAEPLLRRLAQDPHLGVKNYAAKALAALETSS